MFPQSNLIDVTKISRIPTDISDKIQNLLGLESPHVPLGLLEAANEILVAEGVAPVSVAWPSLPTSDSAQLANCEVLSRVANGPPSLVTRKNGQSVLPFVARLCATFPQSRIIVTVPNKRTGKETVNFLRSQGEDCWFLDNDYRLREEQAPPDHRIRIVCADMLYLSSLQLNRADIVVVTDAARFVAQKMFGFDSNVLFDLRFGTHFSEDVRLVGIIDDDVPLMNMREVWSVFGLRTHILNTQGEAYLAPRVTWVTRSKQDRSLFASGLTHESSNLEKIRTLVWENLPRNNAILRLARRLKHEAKDFAFVQERLQGGLFSPVAIVVENTLHKKEMYRQQGDNSELIPVMAFENVEQRDDLPSFLVRADAGTGLLPLLPQRHGIWVVDVQDQTSKYLSRRVRLRQKAYLKAWHVGEQPFVSKWQSVPVRQNQ